MSVDLDFYLSEMSVSDRHGGGLTLQRVLGADLDRIGLFAHVSRFATDYPVSDRLKARCLDVPIWTEANAARTAMGCTFAAWVSGRQTIMRLHARRVASKVCALDSTSGGALRGLVCPQTAISMCAMEALAKRRPVEYLTWVMDDHLVRWDDGSWRYPPRDEELLARHLRSARCVFVISLAMGQFLTARFGVESEVLFGPADPCAEPQWEVKNRDGRIRLGYFGAVGRWQLDALHLLANSLEAANASLDVYTGDSSLADALRLSGVAFCGRILPAEVRCMMRNYDAVVLPVSFEPRMRNMSEFNIATKMSECLASGTVTLLVGPSYSAMARFLEPSGAALIATESSAGAVADVVGRLRDRDYRIAVLKSAQELVRSRLSTTVMREVWLKGVSRLG